MENAITRFTLQDVVNMEGHAELIRGQLCIENRTTVEHNKIVTSIAREFGNYIEANKGECLVFQENVALYCSEISDECKDSYLLPDLMVICSNLDKVEDDGIRTAPDFVLEVTSPTTRTTDYGAKADIYCRLGVKEYWVVDLQKRGISIYQNEDFFPPKFTLHPTKIPVGIYDGQLIIDFTNLI
ncbi:MAG: Uma2 family endonuclease [Pseudobutyrivibrio sp.]|nr:Uma2 family endonuclease [Pseudobutyrivibrio sp.]